LNLLKEKSEINICSKDKLKQNRSNKENCPNRNCGLRFAWGTACN
jgi:hypothetical protein